MWDMKIGENFDYRVKGAIQIRDVYGVLEE